MTRKEEIERKAKIRADQYFHPVEWNDCYHHWIEGAEWADSHAWKDAQGEDLPEIDREVIALIQDGDDAWITKVVFAHRPPKHWDGKNILTGEVTRYTPKTYGKGGWNIPNVRWWLDLELPKMGE